MSMIVNYSDAETVFQKWLNDKYPNATKVNFRKVSKNNENIWTLAGDLKVETMFKEKTRDFEVQIDSNGEIISYEIFE